MTGAADLPLWGSLVVAALVLTGAALALLGTLGLLRLRSFYQRVHAPTLGTSLGAICVLAGSVVHFSLAQGRPVLHEILIAVFVILTTPITFMLLVRAALYRDRVEGSEEVPGEATRRSAPGRAPSDQRR